MASTGFDKETGVQAHERHLNGDTYGTDGEMAERHGSAVEDSPEVLQAGIEALERKKTAWWAYLATKDFWLVLAIG
jgi:solute carrier family 35 protein F1/2